MSTIVAVQHNFTAQIVCLQKVTTWLLGRQKHSTTNRPHGFDAKGRRLARERERERDYMLPSLITLNGESTNLRRLSCFQVLDVLQQCIVVRQAWVCRSQHCCSMAVIAVCMSVCRQHQSPHVAMALQVMLVVLSLHLKHEQQLDNNNTSPVNITETYRKCDRQAQGTLAC